MRSLPAVSHSTFLTRSGSKQNKTSSICVESGLRDERHPQGCIGGLTAETFTRCFFYPDWKNSPYRVLTTGTIILSLIQQLGGLLVGPAPRPSFLKISAVGSKLIIKMIMACKALKSFSSEWIDYGPRYLEIEESSRFNGIVCALHSHNDTLTHLELDFGLDDAGYDNPIRDTLRKLSEPRGLFVTASALFGYGSENRRCTPLKDLLPKTIETLHTNGFNQRVIGGLLVISDDPRTLFPNLKFVQLSGAIEDIDDDNECDEIIQRHFEHADVQP